MQHLRAFLLSEGDAYQRLLLAAADLEPRSVPGALSDGLDGWSFLMRTAGRDFALAYFENKVLAVRMKGFTPRARYSWTWFDPRTGKWGRTVTLSTDSDGVLTAPPFPAGGKQTSDDVAAKILGMR
jgi:hypothetical protein